MSKIQGEGEGDYVSGKKFQETQRRFAQQGPADEAGRAAADALAGPEADELEKARRDSAKGPAHEAEAVRHTAHRDRKLDESLEQTYPASDPAPVTPGSD